MFVLCELKKINLQLQETSTNIKKTDVGLVEFKLGKLQKLSLCQLCILFDEHFIISVVNLRHDCFINCLL